jgi:hypothetical protein
VAVSNVIARTHEIVLLLERPKPTAWSNALRDNLDLLQVDPHSSDALSFLYDACTKAKGLADVWIEGHSQDSWARILNDLKQAIDDHRESSI